MESDMEIGEGQPQGCPFFGDGSDDFGESTLPVCLQSQTPGISQAVPLSLRKNAKGGGQSAQLAFGSDKCRLSSNAFSRAPRGSQPPKSGATVPDASPPAVPWHAWVGCFCPGGTKRRGSLWKSKKYLEFFKRHCYGENLYVKTLFEK